MHFYQSSSEIIWIL